MGGIFAKKYANYELPFKPVSLFPLKDKKQLNTIKGYQSHLIPSIYEVKAYAL